MLFKVDENLPSEVASILRAAGHDAVSVVDQQMSGAADPKVASVCREERRSLVTLDLDFSDIRTYPPADFPGLIVLRPISQAKPTVLSLVNQLLSGVGHLYRLVRCLLQWNDQSFAQALLVSFPGGNGPGDCLKLLALAPAGQRQEEVATRVTRRRC